MSTHNFDYDTIVIGGGFAGVSAVRDLADQGYHVLLLEARNRLGGRTWSETKKVGDFEGVVEHGGQWIWSDRQINMVAEVARYGITVEHSPFPDYFPTLAHGEHNPGPLPVPLEEIYDFEKAYFRIMTDVHRITRGVPLDKQNLSDLDIPWGEYLDNLGVGPKTRAFFSFIGANNAARYPDETSALPLLAFVAGLDHSLLRTWGVVDEYLKEGTGALVNAMADDSGADIRYETPVARVEQNDDGVTVTTRAGDSFTAKTAVIATPLVCWSDIVFSPVLSPVKTAMSAERHVSYPIKFWAQVKGAPKPVATIADADSSNGAFIAFTQHDLGDDGQVIVGFFIDHPDRPSFGTDFAGVEQFIQTLYPGAELVAFDLHRWVTDEWSGNGGYVAFQPGRISQTHSELGRPEGKLFFATSDIATSFNGWIEGAVDSGKKAAVDAARQMTRDAIEVAVRAHASSAGAPVSAAR
ncbi:FAD-dependent oxidoreductase [Gordonia sp. TBRC 11910]|uniref:FAD-dependent oxidoreductase n=1 Tax=Gordonia asplenii TaxID=2725283 RepID=A0A848KU75_9ACTN|nr:NAD(P)/FAD-dependent oxidoreductase [Gordonia asplenii]NMO02246.1 FAD-dependent oxidoreductase [Gordonia asplenii]